LNPDLNFAGQVHNWLLLLEGSFAVKHEITTSFDIITVKQNDKMLLMIRLIDLGKWVVYQDQAREELTSFNSKQEEIRRAGISFVTLWEDVWIREKSIVKSRLKAMLGISQRIPARMTKVRRIDKLTADQFLNVNHLQHTVSSKIKYGLFLPNQYFRVLNADHQSDRALPELLVAVATFSNPRIFKRDEKPFKSYELIRFANLLNTTVVGGFDKLLSFFEEDCKPDDIMTYADLEWSDGTSYKRLGFKPISEKSPISFVLNTETNERYSSLKHNAPANLIKICNGGSRKFVKEILASYQATSL
jgi:hypothetical protein